MFISEVQYNQIDTLIAVILVLVLNLVKNDFPLKILILFYTLPIK